VDRCSVASLTLYPLKGAQGVAVESIHVRQGGVVGDRELMLVRDGAVFAQKDHPQLARVAVELRGKGRLRLRSPEAGDFEHEIRKQGGVAAAKLHFNDIATCDQGDEIAQWFGRALGEEGVRVVSLPKPWDRWIPLPAFERVDGRPQHQLYDAAPVLIENQASLDDRNARLDRPVPMDRFRANVVVEGLSPFQEDGIESLSSDEVELLFVTGCERCIMTTTDQKTGERVGKEPIQTLSRYRKRADKYASGIVFGAYMTPRREGRLRVGDRLRVAMRDAETSELESS